MKKSRVKAKLTRNEPVLITSLHLNDPSMYELTSLMGFDGIWLDLEHHGHSLETANELLRAARVGRSDVMVRPAKGEFMRMSRILEAGAQGIMYPRCDNAEEAAEVVRWSKFAPLGTRGVDGANPDMPYCTMPLTDYLREANEQTFNVIQLESPESLEHADAIAALDGVDVLFLGPGDFSILAGIPGQFDHPKIKEARNAIAAAAAAHGKHWGMPAFSTEHASELIEAGARFICHKADIIILKQGLEKLQDDFASLGFTFDNQLGK
jgi:4-hydroxy-2-oxoheptanedioate aldolase